MMTRKSAVILLVMISLALALSISASALRISISGNPVTRVTGNTATIQWTTDEPATSLVQYGEQDVVENSAGSIELVRSHSVVLENLKPNTRYYYRIISTTDREQEVSDRSGSPYSFTTITGADLTPPGFSNIKATSFGETTTTFRWTTSEPATSLLWYGETAPYQLIENANRVTDHSATLTTQSGRLYDVIVGGCDAGQNCANATRIRVLAGAQTGTPSIISNLGPKAKSNRLDISGVTRPFSDVQVFVNELPQKTVIAAGNGSFSIANVILTNPVKSTVKLVVTDAAGNTAEQSQDVIIDSRPPAVEISEIPRVAKTTPLTVTGTVDEHVTISYEVRGAFDVIAPSRVRGLKTTQVAQNIAQLEWQESTETDFYEYAVYRDGVRIATTQRTAYSDSVSSDKRYVYRIAALDRACNEGSQSDPVTVLTPKGGTSFAGEPTPVELTCLPMAQSLEADGAFSFTIGLQEGDNQVKITVVDDAGNKVEFLESSRLDNIAPQFLEDNLDRISPTYIPEVRVKGKVSEKSTIHVFVNDAAVPAVFDTTDDDGNFNIRVPLPVVQGSFQAGISGIRASVATGGYASTIRLRAIDAAGHQTDKGPSTVQYALCDEGSTFGVKFGDNNVFDYSPSVLTPRLIVEGVQEIGLPVRLSYRGRYKADIKRVSVTPVSLSLSEEDEYDNDWIQINYLTSRRNLSGGYARLSFPAQTPEKGQTTAQKEEEIADHRKGECFPGAGCAKFFLVLEIEGQESIPRTFDDIRTQTTTGEFRLEPIRQRTCMPISIQIDKPLHLGEKIPSKFLERSSEFLADTIDIIDTVLDPVTKIGEFTIIGCGLSTGWLFVKDLQEKWSCDISEVAGKVSGGSFDEDVAAIGACELVYGTGGSSPDPAKLRNCKSCQDAKESTLSAEGRFREVCDRVTCPSAPSLQQYIRDNQGSKVKEVGSVLVQGEGTRVLYSGSSCSFKGEEEVGSVVEGRPGLEQSILQKASSLGPGYPTIKEQYEFYLKHKKDSEVENNIYPDNLDCSGLHSADPRCCSTEYYNQWGTACGIPGLGIETFDEVEQSACLAAQAANQLAEFERDVRLGNDGIPGQPGFQCNSLLNSVAGFCEPDTGKPVGDTIATGVFYTRAQADTVGAANLEVHVRINPVPPEDPKEFKITRGHILQRFGEERRDSQRYINEKRDFEADRIENSPSDLTPLFQEKQDFNERSAIEAFEVAFCNGIADTNCRTKAAAIFRDIKGRIGVSEQSYIVRPESSLIRSVQCACIPGVTSYLGFWQNVLGQVKQCVDHTRLTGEGSAGVCQSVLSTYVCDFMYDTLRCFMQKYSVSGAGSRTSVSGLGGVARSITSAGSRMQQRVEGRYGDTALFKTMFVDKKVLHSACAWAFTGSWDFNVKGIFEQSVQQIPIDSSATIYPATRRYVSYNPFTKPAGLTTWTYNFGVGLVAGADLDYRMKLVCSNDFSCEPRDGFKGGRCDCAGRAKKELPINPPELGNGRLAKNGLLNTEIFYTIQGGDLASDVRYDTAVLEWEYEDNNGQLRTGKVEQKIHLTGSDAPNFCRLELLGDPFFSCKFGIGDYAGAAFVEDPRLVKPESGMLLLNQEGEFSVKINLEGESDPRSSGGFTASENTKYLVYDITNEVGVKVADNRRLPGTGASAPIPINTKGDGEYNVKIPQVTESMFGSAAAQARMRDMVRMFEPSSSVPIEPRAIDFEQSIITREAPSGFTSDIIFVFGESGNYDVYKLGTGNSSWTSKGYYPRGAKIEGKSGKILNGILSYQEDNKFESQIRFREAVAPNAEMSMRIRGRETTASACSKFSQAPASWTATFTIFDSKKNQYGGIYEPNYNQPAIDARGEQAVKSIPVNALCNKEAAVAVTGYPANVVACAEPHIANTRACFCGTPAEAQRELDLHKDIIYNCGPGNPAKAAGNYCLRNTNGSRSCSPNRGSLTDLIPVSNGGLGTPRNFFESNIDVSPGEYVWRINTNGILKDYNPQVHEVYVLWGIPLQNETSPDLIGGGIAIPISGSSFVTQALKFTDKDANKNLFAFVGVRNKGESFPLESKQFNFTVSQP